jgi:membrane protease YdiL (CAAX protease family)
VSDPGNGAHSGLTPEGPPADATPPERPDPPSRTADAGGDRPPPRGLTSFTIEGRTAPALFVVAWLAILLGVGMVIVGLLSQAGLAGGLVFAAGLGVLAGGLVCAAGSQAIERRAAGVPRYAGPSPVLVFVAVLPLTIVLVIAVGSPLVALGLDPAGPLAALISVSATCVAYAVLIRLVVVGPGALTWHDIGVRRPDMRVLEDVGWGAVLAVPVLFVTGIVGAILARFLPLPPDVLPTPHDTIGIIITFVAAAVMAPLGEELFFRGFATTAWERLHGFRPAIVRGALFFAFAHVLTLSGTSASEGVGFAAFAFFARVPVALALGWLFLRRRSLYAPIALHATFNGLQVVAAFLIGPAAGG